MALTGTQNVSYIDIGNADIYLAGIPVGSVKNSTFEGSYEKQEHSSGYPKITDKSVITGVKASFKGTWEEVRGENLRVALGVASNLTGFVRNATNLTRTSAVNGRFQVRLIGTGSTNKSYVGALPNPAKASGSDGVVSGGALTTFTSAGATFLASGVKAGDFCVPAGSTNTTPVQISVVVSETQLTLATAMGAESSIPYTISQIGVHSAATAGTLYKPGVDFVYNVADGSIYAAVGGALATAQQSTGECTVYCAYTYATSTYTRLPLGATTQILEIPLLIEKVRSADSRLFQIMFWKCSPSTSFSLPFNADDWQSYEVELVSVKDTAHADSPLGYIDIPFA